jgi:hypothetical protein
MTVVNIHEKNERGRERETCVKEDYDDKRSQRGDESSTIYGVGAEHSCLLTMLYFAHAIIGEPALDEGRRCGRFLSADDDSETSENRKDSKKRMNVELVCARSCIVIGVEFDIAGRPLILPRFELNVPYSSCRIKRDVLNTCC